MKLLQLTLVLFTLAGALASIFPEGEDEVAWHARIDANIDKNRKSDVTIRVKIDPAKLCKLSLICYTDVDEICIMYKYIFSGQEEILLCLSGHKKKRQ